MAYFIRFRAHSRDLSFHSLMLGLALGLMLVALPSSAQNSGGSSSAQPVPGSRGGSTANNDSGEIQQEFKSAHNNPSTELLQYETLAIIKAYEEDKLSIHGMVDDAERLDLNLSQSRTESRLVVLEGDNEVGKSTLVKMHVILSGDHVYRLNLDNYEQLRRQNEKDAVRQLDMALSGLREKARKDSGRRVILWVDNASRLKAGTLPALNVLVESLADRNGHYTIIETSPETLRDQDIFKKFPEINRQKIVQRVEPLLYDNTRAYLNNNLERIESWADKKVSSEAVDEAARIHSSYYKDKSHTIAWQILSEAAKEAINDEKAGGSKARVMQAKQKVKELSKEIQNLKGELKIAESSELRTRLSVADKALQSAELEVTRLTSNDGKVFALAQLDIEKDALERQYLDLKEKPENKKPFPLNRFSPDYEELKAIERRLEIKRKEILSAETDLKTADKGQLVTRNHVLRVASKWLNKPINELQANFAQGLKHFDRMYGVIFEQNHVLDTIKDSLYVRATHLNDGAEIKSKEDAERVKQGVLKDAVRPVGSYWFGGDTGVGKTETAIELAQTLGYELFRFDMSEFKEKHYVARLIGSPNGYANSDEPGELTGKVRKVENAVLLFDEIEKAHPDVQDILLQVLDYGRLSDRHGAVDFRNTIVIVTSNLAREVARMSEADMYMKLAALALPEQSQNAIESIWKDVEEKKITTEEATTKSRQALNDLLLKSEAGQHVLERLRDPQTGKITKSRLTSEVYISIVSSAAEMNKRGMNPIRRELLERFSHILVFNDINEATAVKIFKKNLQSLMDRMKYFYDIQLNFSQEAFDRIGKRFKLEGGGRAIRRVVVDLLSAPLAKMIYEKQAQPGDVVIVDVNAEGVYSRTTMPGEEYEKLAKGTSGDEEKNIKSGWFDMDAIADQWNKMVETKQIPGFAAEGELTRTRTKPPEYVLNKVIMERVRKWGGRR